MTDDQPVIRSPRSRRRRGAILTCLIGAVAAVTLGTSVLAGTDDGSSRPPNADAGSPTSSPSSSASEAVMTVPLQHDDLVEALTAHDGQPGYGQVVVSPDEDEVILYWKGSPPRDVARLVGVAVDGTRVRLVNTPFSSNDIRDASKRVWDKAVALYGPGVVASMSGTRESDGLIVHTTERIDLEPLELVAGMPLRQETGEPGGLLDDPAG